MSGLGIDYRPNFANNNVIIRAALQDANGNPITSGTATLWLMLLQSGGTLRTFDWGGQAFQGWSLGAITPSTTMTHQTIRGTNFGDTINTGIWTKVVTDGTDFTTTQGILIQMIHHPDASPPYQWREFQLGEGIITEPPAAVYGAVSDDENNTPTQFTATLSGPLSISGMTSEFWNDAILLFTGQDSSAEGVARSITSHTYSGGILTITLDEALPFTPADIHTFVIIKGTHTHSISQIQSGLATESTQETIEALLKADAYVDTTTDPWELVLVSHPATGTGGTELMRKQLYSVTGEPITSTNTVIGQAIQ